MPPLILKFNTHDVNDSNLRLASMLCIYAHKQLTQASPGAPSLFLLGKGMAEYSFLHKPIMHQLPTLSTSVAGVHPITAHFPPSSAATRSELLSSAGDVLHKLLHCRTLPHTTEQCKE